MMTDTANPSALRESFAAVYEMHRGGLRAYLWNGTGNDAVADDLTSETFLRGWKHYAAFDGRSVKAWLYKIARNLLIDLYRRKAEQSLDKVIGNGIAYGEHMADDKADLDRLVEQWDRTERVQAAVKGDDLVMLMGLYWQGSKQNPNVGERVRLFRLRERLRSGEPAGAAR